MAHDWKTVNTRRAPTSSATVGAPSRNMAICSGGNGVGWEDWHQVCAGDSRPQICWRRDSCQCAVLVPVPAACFRIGMAAAVQLKAGRYARACILSGPLT